MIENNLDYQAKKHDFETYYQQIIVPALMPFEQERRKYLAQFIAICTFVVAWIAFTIINFPHIFNSENDTTGSIFGLASCLVILLLCWPMLRYYKRSKENLLPLITGYFGKFDYVYQPSVSHDILEQSKIMKSYDKLSTDDSFNGQYEGVPVTITEYTRYKYQKPTKERPQGTYKKLAHGIFFWAKMNKNFSGQTIVVKDKGFLNKFAKYKNLAKVGLESTEFEEKYEVYSDNQIEARYILTPTMLEYMLELKSSFTHTEYSFYDNMLFMNIELKENYFEASNFFRPIINRKNIEKIFTELYLLFSIVETLKLNQQRLL